MNTELFIARKIAQKGDGRQNRMSNLVIRIATVAIALSLTVMIISVAVLMGFKREIRNKVIGFGSHIQITQYDTNISLEPSPIKKDSTLEKEVKKIAGIKNIQPFATKPGILKTKTEIEGVVLKGISKEFDWSFFKKNLVEGRTFELTDTGKTNDILLSQKLASKLNLKTGDNVLVYFIQRPPRMRKFTIAGIYKTGMEEFDSKFLMADIKHIQKLNDWDSTKIGGYEVLINDFNKIDQIGEKVFEATGFDLNARTIKDIYPQIFDWLNLTDMNVRIILILMVIVAVINMTTTLLIMILERTNMIGILKSLGFNNWQVQKVFLYNAGIIIGKGLLIGNVVGVGLCLLQKYTSLIKLDEESYYVAAVPVKLDLYALAGLNLGTLLVCLIVLIIPSFIISGITPVKAIRFR